MYGEMLMEIGGCMNLVEQLMEEAARKIALVHQVMSAHATQPATTQQGHASPTALACRDHSRLQTERGWLEKAYHALSVAHNAFAKLEQCERQSGTNAPYTKQE
jgi:hypothetical protein